MISRKDNRFWISIQFPETVFGMENGTFANQTMYAVSSLVMSFTAGAFRDKTKLDLVVANVFDGTISILLNSCP